MEVRADVLVIGVPADVTVKFAIEVVARITDLGGPDLLASLDITCKNGGSVRANGSERGRRNADAGHRRVLRVCRR